jgi:hypothetical protein
MSNDLWRWADPNGQQRKVRLDELRAALAEGHIAPNTPVWRSGFHSWQPAHEVPELTSASVGSANGVVLNIPPPPLAMVAVQQEYETASASLVPAPPSTPRPTPEEEPPPPPHYVPAPTKPIESLKTQLGGSAFVPPAPGSSARSLGAGASNAPPRAPSLPTKLGIPPPPEVLAARKVAPEIEELSASMLSDSSSSPDLGVQLGPDGLPPPTNPILHDTTERNSGDAYVAGLPRRPGLSLILDDIAAIRQGRPPRNKLLIGVLGVVGLSVLVMLVAGIISIASGSPSSDATAATSASAPVAKAAPSSVPSAEPPAAATAAAVIPPPPPPAETKTAALGDCTVSGDAKTIAPRAVVASGIEARTVGKNIAFGFSSGGKDAVAISLDPSSLAPVSTVHAKAIGGDPRRVTPLSIGGKLAAVPDVDRKSDRLGHRRVIGASPLVDVGVADGGLAWAPHGKDSIAKLFGLEGEGAIEALRGTGLDGKKGIAITFRRGNAIIVGAAKGDGALEAEGNLSKIAGLGQVGSPAIATSGEQVIVAWADRAGASDEWKIRWAKLKIGGSTEEATSFALPAGGLGGAAMSPSVASLGGGRFLLAWAEGPVSNHQVRAITMDADGSPSGAPLAISGPGVNAGQPAAIVGADGRGAVAFLAAKGKALEVHATPISCPR